MSTQASILNVANVDLGQPFLPSLLTASARHRLRFEASCQVGLLRISSMGYFTEGQAADVKYIHLRYEKIKVVDDQLNTLRIG